jgi:hypothetical protein
MAGSTATGFCATTCGGPTDQKAPSGISRTKRSALSVPTMADPAGAALEQGDTHQHSLGSLGTAGIETLRPADADQVRSAPILGRKTLLEFPLPTRRSPVGAAGTGTAVTTPVQTRTVTVYATVSIQVGLAQ